MRSIAPKLVTKETINVPHDPVAVLGFRGRNAKLGRDALILKRDALPVNGPFVGIPDDQMDTIIDDGRDLYVVDDGRVVGMTASEFREYRALQTFEDWGGEQLTCYAFHGDDATVWDRDVVEVTTK